jgi:hypothetical protein
MIFPLALYSSSRAACFFAAAELEAQHANSRSRQWAASVQQRLSYPFSQIIGANSLRGLKVILRIRDIAF